MELELGVDAPLAQREGGPIHHIPLNIGRVPIEAVQSQPQIEMGCDPQIPLAEVNEDRNLGSGVGIEMSDLQPVEVKEPTEEGPHGQCEALLVKGPEHDGLGLVLRRELLAVAASPPGDLLLWEDIALHHVLDVRLL